jgi:glycosyltransferase involved in cell wall biosynthesis
MACGRPVVVSSVGEGARIVQNHACGSIADADNPSSFAEEITYLLKHRKEAEEMGVRSRLAVEHDYTWERVSRETEAVYSTLK